MNNSLHKVLAGALSKAKAVSRDGILRASDLERGVKERLSFAGCLIEIIKGWYLLTKPGAEGGSTAWFGCFWNFVGFYLADRFGKKGYCLSAESSLDIHAGEVAIGQQITIITKKNSNQVVQLPHQTSLYLYTDAKNFPKELETRHALNIMPLAPALCRLSPTYYRNKPLNIDIALRLLPSVSDISRVLLENSAVTPAARLAGAYRAIGEAGKAVQIEEDMAAAGFDVKPCTPFLKYESTIVRQAKIKSPHVGRIVAMWSIMREQILQIFPKEPGKSGKGDRTLAKIQELYTQDAYHSLSIEGYHVTTELIRKIAAGDWDPENEASDKNQVNALAARGYHDAFVAVLDSTRKVLQHRKSPAMVFESDLQVWYRQLFSPSVRAGLLKSSDLAGYRNTPVFIRHSRHVPLPVNAVVDAMETLFELLKKEESAAVRAVLGHFVFVYIHPYMDGNGRIGRFLMNLMLVSGGYPWTILHMENRKTYMAALEQASVHHEIIPFARYILSEMK